MAGHSRKLNSFHTRQIMVEMAAIWQDIDHGGKPKNRHEKLPWRQYLITQVEVYLVSRIVLNGSSCSAVLHNEIICTVIPKNERLNVSKCQRLHDCFW